MSKAKGENKMLVSEITQSTIPALHYDDTIEEAIELLQQNNLQHLPVLNEEKYEGLLSLDELIAAEDSDHISTLKNKFIHVSISANQHFLTALKDDGSANVSVLPVLSPNNEYIGGNHARIIACAIYIAELR